MSIYLLRHCESYFNLHFKRERRDPGIEDPELTPEGHAHAGRIAADLRELQLQQLIISPYLRTLQTAGHILKDQPVTAVIEGQVRERTAYACDIGSHPKELARRFPQHDFAHLPDRWWHEGFETAAEIEARAADFRASMAARTEQPRTLVVTHWAFILALTGKSLANGEWVQFDPAAPPPAQIDWEL
jgi:glucosyl-3-phosphoglycerate phosphatase